jgi:tryptophan synthase alpha chain
MSSELSKYLRNRLEEKKILLMTHTVVGYPSLEDNWRMLEEMQAANVDMVELQMPFSEPIADGPLFVKANQEALRNGVDWNAYFDFMRRAHEKFDFPLLLIGYYNSAFAMGHRSFCSRLAEHGASGYLLPDLPLEEFDDLLELSKNHRLNPIMLCTPTHKDARLKKICANGSGFLYCVARKGVTGAVTKIDPMVFKLLGCCRKYSDLPLALGFGLSTGEDLQQLQGYADIAVIGSALLQTWEKKGPEAYREHLKELDAATV